MTTIGAEGAAACRTAGCGVGGAETVGLGLTPVGSASTIEAMRGAIARVFEGGVWTPPDIDLGAGSDAGTANLMARLASVRRAPQLSMLPSAAIARPER